MHAKEALTVKIEGNEFIFQIIQYTPELSDP